jgi:hypothetical protein
MLHVMFFIYPCICENGRGEKFLFSMERPWLGHDPSFQAAAHAIEERIMRV